jgi:hypothetical protein
MHGPVAAPVQPVRQELRRREHVPQLVIDLADRQAELRQTALLAQFVRQGHLHPGEGLLREPDLIHAIRRRDHPRSILRIGGKFRNVARQPPHGAHDHPLQGEVEEGRGDRRDQQGQKQDVAREIEHRGAQRAGIEDQLDEIDSHARADDPDRAVARIDQLLEGVADENAP